MPDGSSREPRTCGPTKRSEADDELRDAVTDAQADMAGREFIDVLLWRITVPLPPPPKGEQARRILENTPLTQQERIEHDSRARAREGQVKHRVSRDGGQPVTGGWIADSGAAEDESTIKVRVTGERVELDEWDPSIDEMLNRWAWNRIQERYAQPIALRLDQGIPVVTLGDGRRIPGQRAERCGRRPALSPADLIDRLACCTYLPQLTDDELARLRAHLDTPVSASRLKKDPSEGERRQRLQKILNYNDELRRTGAPAVAAEPPAQSPAATTVAVDAADTCAGGTEDAPTDTPKAVHNADFTMVNWYGTEYTFALGVQSSVAAALWTEWEKTGLGLHQETIRKAVDAERDSFRMDTALRNHPAFGTMIRRCGDGRYKLAPPSAEPPAPTPPGKKKRQKRA